MSARLAVEGMGDADSSMEQLTIFPTTVQFSSFMETSEHSRTSGRSLAMGASTNALFADEKREPMRCGVWKLTVGILESCALENERAIAALRKCRRENTWPTGTEEMRVLDVCPLSAVGCPCWW